VNRLAAFLTIAATAALSAQQVFRSGVDVTTIDVTVIARSGDPVRDLKAEDFTVTVDGKPRAIVSAQFVGFDDESPAESAPAAAPRGGFNTNHRTVRGRLVVLLVDRGNIRMGAERSVLRAAEGFLDRLRPSDRVSLLTIPTGPVVAFTGDRDRVKSALRQIVGDYRLPVIRHNIAAVESLRIEDGDLETLAKVIDRECARGDSGCAQEIELEARGMAPQVRAKGLDTIRSFSDVFTYLKTIEGPKTVALVSEGLILDQQRFPGGLPPEVEKLASQARATVYVLRLHQEDFDATDVKPLRSIDIAAQTIGLETLAGTTGGEIFTVVGTGESIFSRMTRELSGEYLLGIETVESDRDGKSHRIKVSVRRGRVDVRSRREFVADAAAPRPGELSVSAAVVNALRSPILQTGLPIRASTYTLLDPDRAKVRVVVAAEIGEGFTQPARMALGYELADLSGNVVKGNASGTTLVPDREGRLLFRQEFSVAPGAYTFKIAATDASARLGSLDRPVDARFAAAGPLSIADLIVNDEAAADLRVEPPVPGPRLSCAIDMRTPPGALPAGVRVTFEVVDGSGKTMASVPAALVSSSDGVRHIARGTIDVSGLAAGAYVARAVVHASGQPDATVTRSFRVVR
jgi:VWFA-related protein